MLVYTKGVGGSSAATSFGVSFHLFYSVALDELVKFSYLARASHAMLCLGHPKHLVQNALGQIRQLVFLT